MRLQDLTGTLNRNVENVDDLTGALEAMALTIVSRLAGWAASIPNAILVSRSAVAIFGVSVPLGYSIAIALELIGHSLVEGWQNAKSWNAGKRKADLEANAKLALVLMIVYFALDVLMVGALATSIFLATSDAQIFLSLAYPLVGILATIGTNERASLFRMKKALQIERQDAKEKRTSKRTQARTQPGIDAGNSDITDGRRARGLATIKQARTILAENDGLSGAELGRQLGISERQGLRIKSDIVSGNGHH